MGNIGGGWVNNLGFGVNWECKKVLRCPHIVWGKTNGGGGQKIGCRTSRLITCNGVVNWIEGD